MPSATDIYGVGSFG